VNRPINFPALVFLLLFALMLLLNGSAILSWASRPVFGSGRSIDGPAVEKASLVHPPVAGPFPDPVEIKVSANYQQEYSSVDAGRNKPPEHRAPRISALVPEAGNIRQGVSIWRANRGARSNNS
jgi:hypothetical protein